MRIAFNGQRLAGQRLGVGRYIEYMLRHWGEQLTGDDQLTLYVRRPLDWTPTARRARVSKVLLESGMSGIPWETLRLRSHAAKHDVLFCPSYTIPVGFRGKSVVATHSVTEVQPGLENWKYRQTYSRLYRHCARAATGVIVPSAITKQSVVEYYGTDPDNVAVIPQGADDVFQPGTPAETLREVRIRHFGADRPFILFVGKCSARRNIPRLIEAFAQLRRTRNIPHGLLLFGPNHLGLPIAELCHSLGVERDVVQTDGTVAQHADLVPLYSAAELFVHPSEYEGWSMTTVEAMACGAPVVATNRGGLAEVAGGHALMVDDPTVDALADAIGRVLDDSALRADLSRRARARGAALNWSTITRNTLQVVRNAANGAPINHGIQ